MDRVGRNDTLGIDVVLVAALSFGCVLYVLVAGAADPDALAAELGSAVPAAQASLVPGGLAFAAASYAGGRLPRWNCAAFAPGLVLLIMTFDGPAELVLAGEGLRDLGLAGMGMALIRVPRLHAHRHGVAAGT